MKNKPRKKKTSKVNFKVRVTDDYHWLFLEKLHLDLKEFLTDDENSMVLDVLKSKNFTEYLSLSQVWGLQSIGPLDSSVPNIRAKLLISSLLRKFEIPGDRDKRVAAALNTFYDSEINCFRYNQFLWRAMAIGNGRRGIEFNTYLLKFIRMTIGDELPDFGDFHHWERHGPGSTTGTKGIFISSYWKFCNWPYDVTEGARKHARNLIRSDARWLGALEEDYRKKHGIAPMLILNQDRFWESVLSTTLGSRITTVPKTALTERTIAIEPTLNLYLQIGVDGFIRRRLMRWGIDLDCQAKNQELARRGSKNGLYATIDLKAASDSISLKLVKQILPSQWFTYLNDIRSQFGYIQIKNSEDIFEFEKFSSMGNGFTFALESLIFAGVVYAATRMSKQKWDPSECAIYGDDLIVRHEIVSDVLFGLKLCGFAVNSDKSFFEGPVRESCGADWVRGFDVRPVQLKKIPRNVKELFSDYNRIKRQLDLWFSKEEPEILKLLTRWIPKCFIALKGPYSDEEFDTHLHSKELGVWEFSQYFGRRAVSLPIPYKGPTKFLFRKLMADLLGTKSVSKYSTNVRAGCTFDVVDRNMVRHAIVPISFTSNWCTRYNPRAPKGASLSWLKPVGEYG